MGGGSFIIITAGRNKKKFCQIFNILLILKLFVLKALCFTFPYVCLKTFAYEALENGCNSLRKVFKV